MNTGTLSQGQSGTQGVPNVNHYGSRLPINFVKQGSVVTTYRKTKTSNFRRLPFVAKRCADTETPCWDVPALGGYLGGYETGETMAHALLKSMRADGLKGFNNTLTHIVESFMVRFEQEGGSSMANRVPMSEWSQSYESFRGQYVGFFNELSSRLETMAYYLGSNLDTITEKDITRRASMGLSFDSEGYMASLTPKIRR